MKFIPGTTINIQHPQLKKHFKLGYVYTLFNLKPIDDGVEYTFIQKELSDSVVLKFSSIKAADDFIEKIVSN